MSIPMGKEHPMQILGRIGKRYVGISLVFFYARMQMVDYGTVEAAAICACAVYSSTRFKCVLVVVERSVARFSRGSNAKSWYQKCQI